ncbi:integrase core domain-containing protein, partial [Streptomyces sp. NPDC007205]|uniref:IS3 family transposase n=1 Tax=Streptomyces sp. NPDC007205 TaxID=3154316 RepID=UPI0033D298C1
TPPQRPGASSRHPTPLTCTFTPAGQDENGSVKGVIFHSGRGSEYVSRRFKRACRRLGVTQSMGRRVGSCSDNAVSEAVSSVLKAGYVHRRTFFTRAEARLKIATWITGFYNSLRLHVVCGHRSPIDYERNHHANSALDSPLRRSSHNEEIDKLV